MFLHGIVERTEGVLITSERFPKLPQGSNPLAVDITYTAIMEPGDPGYQIRIEVPTEEDRQEQVYPHDRPVPGWIYDLAVRYRPSWYALRFDGTMPGITPDQDND